MKAMKRWYIYAGERPQERQVVEAETLGDALAACKVMLGPTAQPCAYRADDSGLGELVHALTGPNPLN